MDGKSILFGNFLSTLEIQCVRKNASPGKMQHKKKGPRSGNLFGSTFRGWYANWTFAPPKINMTSEKKHIKIAYFNQKNVVFPFPCIVFRRYFEVHLQKNVLSFNGAVTTQQFLAHSKTWKQIGFKSVTIRAKGLPVRNLSGLWHLSSNWQTTTLPRSSKYPYVENKLPLISNTFTLQTRHCCQKMTRSVVQVRDFE